MELHFRDITHIPQHDNCHWLLDSLKSNKDNRLKALDIGANAIDDEAAEKIATFIKYDNMIEKLDLFGNGIGPDTTLNIIDSLRHNKTLVWLSLSRKNSDDFKRTVKAEQKLINKDRGNNSKLNITFL